MIWERFIEKKVCEKSATLICSKNQHFISSEYLSKENAMLLILFVPLVLRKNKHLFIIDL